MLRAASLQALGIRLQCQIGNRPIDQQLEIQYLNLAGP